MLPSTDVRTDPRGPSPALIRELTRLFAAFPGSVRHEEQVATLASYADALADVPLDALAEAIRDAIATSPKLPRVAELRAGAKLFQPRSEPKPGEFNPRQAHALTLAARAIFKRRLAEIIAASAPMIDAAALEHGLARTEVALLIEAEIKARLWDLATAEAAGDTPQPLRLTDANRASLRDRLATWARLPINPAFAATAERFAGYARDPAP